MRYAFFAATVALLIVLVPAPALAVESCTASGNKCCVCKATGPNCYNCHEVPSSQGGFTQCGEPGPCRCISTDIPCGAFFLNLKPAGPWGLASLALIPEECRDFKPLGASPQESVAPDVSATMENSAKSAE